MKLLSNVALAAMLLLVFGCNNQDNNGKDIQLTSEIDSVSYSLGLNVAKSAKAQGIEYLNIDALRKAFNDVYSDNEPLISDMDAGQCLNTYLQKAQMAKSDASMEAGQAFLAQKA